MKNTVMGNEIDSTGLLSWVEGFPKNLNEFTQADPLPGGCTESTYILTNPSTRERYVLKLGASDTALQAEIMTNVLYQIMDVPVPKMQAYNPKFPINCS